MRVFRSGMSYGFEELDEATSGLNKGDLTVVASRPGVGKTSFAMNIALHAAALGKKVIYFSAQHEKKYLEACFALQKFLCGNYDERMSKIHIEDAVPLSVDGIKKVLESKQDVDLVIIDYYQLLYCEKKKNRTLELAFISAELKKIAFYLEIPIICLTQLGRWWKIGTRPKLSDMDEPIGALVQDSDTFLFLQREPNSNKAECVVAKARYGKRNKVINLKWQASRLRFSDGKACSFEDGVNFYRDIGKVLLSDNPLDIDLRRELRLELMEKYNLTEIEAVNVLNGRNISDYVSKYKKRV